MSIRRHARRSFAATLSAAAGLMLFVPCAGEAQTTRPRRPLPAATFTPLPPDSNAPPPAPAECYGFAFGRWAPALDWRAAGHGADVPSVTQTGEFASRDSSGTEPSLILFPSWWPAGVGVRFARAPRAAGDTVPGVAQAFVADGALRPPRTTVRAWLKACGSR